MGKLVVIKSPVMSRLCQYLKYTFFDLFATLLTILPE
jgi:hypothetical protein